jgi:hypothetical protein
MVAGLLQKKLHTPFYVSNYYKEVLAVAGKGKVGLAASTGNQRGWRQGYKSFFLENGV